MDIIKDQIAALKREQDELINQFREQHEACKEQARSTLNDSDRPRLKIQAEQLKEQFKKKYGDLNREIERLERGEPPELTPEVLSRFKAEFRNEWEANLHWLNYHRPENSLHRLVRVKQQEAILLLIQQWTRMKADLYIKRIKNIFDDGRLRPFTEDFSDEGRVDPQRFLERWQTNLQIEEPQVDVQSIIQKLRSAARDQTLFLEIRVAQVSNDFCGWFLEKFWRPLIAAKGISAIVILMTDEPIPKGQMQGECLCNVTRFERSKYCKIKLRNWQQSEIERWMEQYLNTAFHKRNLSPQDASLRAKQVYTQSEKGVPRQAHNYILGDFLTQVVEQLPGQRHATR